MNIILGGQEIVVGSAEYVIYRRESSYKNNNDSYEKNYNVDFVYPHDVAESVLKEANDNKILQDSIKKLIKILDEKENSIMLAESKISPNLTSSELQKFLENHFYDNDKLVEINKKLKELTKLLKLETVVEDFEKCVIPENIEPKSRYNDQGLMKLEQKMSPYVCILERNQGILAVNCDRIVNELTGIPNDDEKIDITTFTTQKDIVTQKDVVKSKDKKEPEFDINRYIHHRSIDDE